jgi:hypothetical protein
MTDDTNISFKMGYQDAHAGHGPSLLGGPYMEGYKKGRHEQGKTVGIRVGPHPEDVVKKLRAEIEDLRGGKYDADEAQKNAWTRVRELESELEAIRVAAGEPPIEKLLDCVKWLNQEREDLKVRAVEAELESERNRLGDECDRLVIEWFDKVKTLEEEREQILTRVRALLMWVPKDNANRKWFEERYA